MALNDSTAATSQSTVVVSLVNSSIMIASNETAADAGQPYEGSLDEAALATRVLLVFFLLQFAAIGVLCIVLIVHMRYNRFAAFKGDDAATRKIILPAFEPLLAVLGVSNGLVVVFLSVTLSINYYDTVVPHVVLESLYSVQQFGFMLILVFMLQKSVSIPALRRATMIALVLSGYTIPYIWYVTTYGDPAKQIMYVKWLHVLRALVLLLSVYVFIWPPNRASERTLRELAGYNIVRYALATIYMVLVINPATRSKGKYALFVTLIYAAFNPIVIWRVLKADTGYWRGMGQRACALQHLFKQKNHIHEGISSGGFHVLIEMHRKYIIDFAHLDIRQQIGVGSTSTVFRGTLKSKFRVAIKVYQPTSFTEDVIAGFSHEAALCGLLHHPNIVKFFGMCVSPPTICLVFELCQGSLEDVMRVHSRRQYEPSRQQLIINVGYMLDAARAVAYIHSFSPPFIHRDIKPSNFLVDADCNIKLSDFGESRTLTKLEEVHTRQLQLQVEVNGDADRAKDGWIALDKIHSPSTETVDEARGSMSSNTDGRNLSQWKADKKGKGTAAYMAPEVIKGKRGVTCYDQAADVYSLAITMWDILNPGTDKFANQSHLNVFESVLSGDRPRLDPSLPLGLRDVIQRAWHEDAHMRPSAQAIVSVLEDIQETLCATLVVDVMDELQIGLLHNESSHSALGANSQFSGATATDVLLDRGYVTSRVEATRMGNAWMDAGLLHHAKHAHAFEWSSAELYHFDADSNVKLRHALDATARQSTPSGSSIPILVGSTPQGQQRESISSNFLGLHVNDDCACPRLAQRVVDKKAVTWHRFNRKPLARRPVADDLVLTTALLMDNDDDGVGFGSFTEHNGGSNVSSSSRAARD